MTASPDLGGLHPPIPTPFKKDGSLALAALRGNLQRWNDQPLAGYVVGGSNGEFVLLTDDERVEVVAAAREAIPGDRLLTAGAGTQSTDRTIALAMRMAEVGAEALLVVNPSYYRSVMSVQAHVEHFGAVADASPIPVMLYNVPANTGLDLPLAAVRELAEHPNVIGIKDSSGDLVRVAETVQQTPDDFQVLAGSGSFVLPALAVGAVGAIAALANVAGGPLVELMDRYQQGDLVGARAIQGRLLAPNRAVTAQYGVPGLKAALDMLGFYGGPVRGPLLPLDDSAQEELRSILAASDLLPA